MLFRWQAAALIVRVATLPLPTVEPALLHDMCRRDAVAGADGAGNVDDRLDELRSALLEVRDN